MSVQMHIMKTPYTSDKTFKRNYKLILPHPSPPPPKKKKKKDFNLIFKFIKVSALLDLTYDFSKY